MTNDASTTATTATRTTTPQVLTPCPPRKHCCICEARLNAVFGSADKTAKYQHQAAEAGAVVRQVLAAIKALPNPRQHDERGKYVFFVKLAGLLLDLQTATCRAASYGNMVLDA